MPSWYFAGVERRMGPGPLSIIGGGGGSSGVGTYDSAHSSSHITLSGAFLVATSGAGATAATYACSFTSHTTGKWYAEFTLTTEAGGTGGAGVGFVNTTAAPDDGIFLGHNANSIGYFSDGSVIKSPAGNSTILSFTTGDFIDVYIDLDFGWYWFRKNNGNWNNNVASNLSDGTGSFNPSELGGGAIRLATEGEDSGDVWTANFAGPPVRSIPSGGSMWG